MSDIDEIDDIDDIDERDHEVVSRRRWLSHAAVGGAVIGAGAIAGAGIAEARAYDGPRRERMVLDVACDGRTFRSTPYADKPEENDNRGSMLYVEGLIYPEGTIPGDGFVVSDAGSVGHWFCTGFNLQHGERPEPHLSATATFVFGRISPSNLFPPDVLVAQGLGGTEDDAIDSMRPLIGGSGEYFGVIGQVSRRNNGRNNTVLRGPDAASPNFIYTFDLLHLV